jgi:DnaJ-class molecular chaperone
MKDDLFSQTDGVTDLIGFALDRVCEYCDGDTDGPCSKCDGRGTVPTEFGQAIINLVAKYLPRNSSDEG